MLFELQVAFKNLLALADFLDLRVVIFNLVAQKLDDLFVIIEDNLRTFFDLMFLDGDSFALI